MRERQSQKSQTPNIQQSDRAQTAKINLIKRRLINRERSILRLSSFRKKSITNKMKNRKRKNLKAKSTGMMHQQQGLLFDDPKQEPKQKGKALSLAKATRINSDRKRKNPYHIYREDKKKQYFDKLNTEYNSQIQRESNDMKAEIMPEKQQKKLAKRRSQGASELPVKKVEFEEQIQIREYHQEQIVATFLENVPFKQEVNEEENKLDA